MSVIFLIGGTGNQLFQYASAAPSDTFSTFFLRPSVRKALKFTDHEQLFKFPQASFISQYLALFVVVMDLAMFRLFKCTLFSTFDLRGNKTSAPILSEKVRLGYFQKANVRRDVSELLPQLRAGLTGREVRNTMHIRGGDLKLSYQEADTPYGYLPPSYYQDALAQLNVSGRVDVYTDDIEFAQHMCTQVSGDYTFNYCTGTLEEMILATSQAEHFVSCNSTLSYWIVKLRGTALASVAPRPFQRRSDMPLDDAVLRVEMAYDQIMGK